MIPALLVRPIQGNAADPAALLLIAEVLPFACGQMKGAFEIFQPPAA